MQFLLSLISVFALLCVMNNAQIPQVPVTQDDRGDGRGGRCRDGRGGRCDEFVVESPVFMQCTCLDRAGRDRCRVWRCEDLDVGRQRA